MEPVPAVRLEVADFPVDYENSWLDVMLARYRGSTTPRRTGCHPMVIRPEHFEPFTVHFMPYGRILDTLWGKVVSNDQLAVEVLKRYLARGKDLVEDPVVLSMILPGWSNVGWLQGSIDGEVNLHVVATNVRLTIAQIAALVGRLVDWTSFCTK